MPSTFPRFSDGDFPEWQAELIRDGMARTGRGKGEGQAVGARGLEHEGGHRRDRGMDSGVSEVVGVGGKGSGSGSGSGLGSGTGMKGFGGFIVHSALSCSTDATCAMSQ